MDPGLSVESLHDYCCSHPGPMQQHADQLFELGVTSRSLLRPGITEQLAAQGIPAIAAFEIVESFRSRFRPGQVGVFHDYSSIDLRVPGVRVLHAVNALRDRLSIFGTIETFKIYVPAGSIDDRHGVDLQDAGAQIISIPKIRKRGGFEAIVDKSQICDALIWAYMSLQRRERARQLYSHVQAGQQQQQNCTAATAGSASVSAASAGSSLNFHHTAAVANLQDNATHLDPVVVLISDDPDLSPVLSKLQCLGVRSIVVTSDHTSGRIVFGAASATLTWPSSFLSSFTIQPSSPQRRALGGFQHNRGGGSRSPAGRGGRQPTPQRGRGSRQPTPQRPQDLVVVGDASPSPPAAQGRGGGKQQQQQHLQQPAINVEQPSPKRAKTGGGGGGKSSTPQRNNSNNSNSSNHTSKSPQRRQTPQKQQHQDATPPPSSGNKKFVSLGLTPKWNNNSNPLSKLGIRWQPLLSSSFGHNSPVGSRAGGTFPSTTAAAAPAGATAAAAAVDAEAEEGEEDEDRPLTDLELLDEILAGLHAATGSGELSRAQVAVEVAASDALGRCDFPALIRRGEAAGILETGGSGWTAWVARRNPESSSSEEVHYDLKDVSSPVAAAAAAASSPSPNQQRQGSHPPQQQRHSASPSGGGCWMSFRLNRDLPSSSAVLSFQAPPEIQTVDVPVLWEDTQEPTSYHIRAFGSFSTRDDALVFHKENFSALPFRPRYYANPPEAKNAIMRR